MITVTLSDGTGKELGSELLAQDFTGPEYLIGRPIGTTNLSPVSKEQEELVTDRIVWWHELDPENTAEIPADLVTASGSGVDPNISPEAAEYQVTRIARERGISETSVRSAIEACRKERFLGFWGEPGINKSKLNA